MKTSLLALVIAILDLWAFSRLGAFIADGGKLGALVTIRSKSHALRLQDRSVPIRSGVEILSPLFALVIYFARALLFIFLSVIPKTSNINQWISILLLISPWLVAGMIQARVTNQIKKAMFLFFAVEAIFVFLVVTGGDTSWDGSNYHGPISLLASKAGSIWGWTDLTFVQWLPSGVEIYSSLYFSGFPHLRLLILPGLISFLLLLRLIVRIFKSRSSKICAVLLLISIPAYFQQLSTTYVDLIVCAVQIGFFFTLVYRHLLSRLEFRILIFVFVAFAFSSKWSSVYTLLGLSILAAITTFPSSSDYKEMVRKILRFAGWIVASAAAGFSPFFIRGLMQFNSPLYPYSTPGFGTSGVMSANENSHLLRNVLLKTNGWQGFDNLTIFYYEYILTPITSFKVAIEGAIEKYVLQNQDADSIFGSRPEIYRSFVYDNRIGGFGILFIASLVFAVYLMIIFIHNQEFDFFTRIFLILFGTLAMLILFPLTMQPRYFLSLFIGFIISLYTIFKKSSVNLSRHLKLFILIFSLIPSIINSGLWYERTHPNQVLIRPPSEYSTQMSIEMNPNCRDIALIGPGMSFYQSLWGPDGCGNVIENLSIGAEFHGMKMDNPNYTRSDIANFVKNVLNKSNGKGVIACTFDDIGDDSKFRDLCDEVNQEIKIQVRFKNLEIKRTALVQNPERTYWIQQVTEFDARMGP